MSQSSIDRGLAVVMGGWSIVFAVLSWLHREKDPR